MKNSVIFVLLIGFILCISFISASSYIEFNQVGNKLVVKQNLSGVYSSYIDTQTLEKTSSGFVFLKKLQFNKSLDNLSVRLNLDNGFVINNQNAYPNSYLLETDGQTISLIWNVNQLTSENSFPMFVEIKNNNSSSIWKIILIIFLVVIFVVGSWVLYLRNNRSKSSGKFEQHLLESEKKVISELKKADRNELWQKQLQLATGFSKAKMSRVIRNLESRELITKIPMGNTNKVVLK